MADANIILYTHGLFAENDEGLQELMNCGFTTLMLWSLHVHANADLYYNDTIIVSNGKINSGTGKDQINPNMPADLARLRSEGGVKNVLFSIGSGGGCDEHGKCFEPDDFQNIQKLLAAQKGTADLKANFTALAKWLSLDGFDFDNEEKVTKITIGTLAAILVPLGKKHIITFCPCFSPDENFWLQCMSTTYDPKVDIQLVKWWNPQAYGGANPVTWIPAMNQYIKTHKIGVSDANSFMCPGVDASALDPAGVQAQFTTWQQDNQLKLQGGFIWNLDNIHNRKSKPADYAKAIAAGLNARAKRAAS